MLKNMPLILVLLIIAVLTLHNYIPLAAQEVLYALSLSIKTLILFMLPVVVFGLLLKTTLQFANQATIIIIFTLLGVCCSNFVSTYLSHFVGQWVYGREAALALGESIDMLQPAWAFSLPRLIPNDVAMELGVALGLILGKSAPEIGRQLMQVLDKIIALILQVITVLIPLFVLGFIVKMHADQLIYGLLSNYALILLVVALAQFSYISLVYALANNFHVRAMFGALKNMLPAAIAGFSTMSSAAAMPLTILATEKNVEEKDFAKAIIPATVNIHLIGDCFAIPIFAYAIMKSFGVAEPTMLQYLTFSLYFVLAKFSVAAIPGGGIIVMLPILEKYLGFNGEMLSLITALYILFDPVITCANVLGNGGFAMLMSRVVQRITLRAAKAS